MTETTRSIEPQLEIYASAGAGRRRRVRVVLTAARFGALIQTILSYALFPLGCADLFWANIPKGETADAEGAPRSRPVSAYSKVRLRPHLSVSEAAERLQAKLPDLEVRALACVECGEGVWWGSGNYVNRIPVCDDVETNRECGRPFPRGTHLCGGCEASHWAELGEEAEACAVHEVILEGGDCPLCEEERGESLVA